jgi:hypothetical protein
MTTARTLADLSKSYITNLVSQTSTDIPFTVKAASGQTADLVQFKNSSNVVVSKIDSAGEFVHPGSIIQVQSVTKTDAGTVTGAIWNDVSGLSLSITPRYSNSKILVMADIKAAGTQDASVVRSRVLRDSTPVGVGDAASNRPRSLGQAYINSAGAGLYYCAQIGGTFMDSPATSSQITYKAQIGGDSTGSTLYINRTQGDRDAAGTDGRFTSSITLMEIAQ